MAAISYKWVILIYIGGFYGDVLHEGTSIQVVLLWGVDIAELHIEVQCVLSHTYRNY